MDLVSEKNVYILLINTVQSRIVATYIKVPRSHLRTRDTALWRYTTYDTTLARLNKKNPKFEYQNCVGLDSSVVECSCAERETRGSSPGSGLYFSVILPSHILQYGFAFCANTMPMCLTMFLMTDWNG